LETGSTTIRNVGVGIGGGIEIWVAIWRGVVADRQAKASQDQANTSQRGLLDERYQKGAEMLGNEKLPVRLSGIYSLARLAREYSRDYHTQIVHLLCAFVRHPVGEFVEMPLTIKAMKDLAPGARFTVGWDRAGEEEGDDRPPRVREDVQAIMTALGGRNEVQIKTEEREKCRLDLVNASLRFAQLINADLNHANLLHADLTCAVLVDAKLKGAYLDRADFTDAQLSGADLSGITMTNCKGLTQAQLDQAFVDPDIPPKLGGVRDAKTGMPLEWRGKPCEE